MPQSNLLGMFASTGYLFEAALRQTSDFRSMLTSAYVTRADIKWT